MPSPEDEPPRTPARRANVQPCSRTCRFAGAIDYWPSTQQVERLLSPRLRAYISGRFDGAPGRRPYSAPNARPRHYPNGPGPLSADWGTGEYPSPGGDPQFQGYHPYSPTPNPHLWTYPGAAPYPPPPSPRPWPSPEPGPLPDRVALDYLVQKIEKKLRAMEKALPVILEQLNRAEALQACQANSMVGAERGRALEQASAGRRQAQEWLKLLEIRMSQAAQLVLRLATIQQASLAQSDSRVAEALARVQEQAESRYRYLQEQLSHATQLVLVVNSQPLSQPDTRVVEASPPDSGVVEELARLQERVSQERVQAEERFRSLQEQTQRAEEQMQRASQRAENLVAETEARVRGQVAAEREQAEKRYRLLQGQTSHAHQHMQEASQRAESMVTETEARVRGQVAAEREQAEKRYRLLQGQTSQAHEQMQRTSQQAERQAERMVAETEARVREQVLAEREQAEMRLRALQEEMAKEQEERHGGLQEEIKALQEKFHSLETSPPAQQTQGKQIDHNLASGDRALDDGPPNDHTRVPPQGKKEKVPAPVDWKLEKEVKRQYQEKKFAIFISFRVFEAKHQALALKEALEDRGLRTFCSSAAGDIKGGHNWVRTICNKLEECRMFVALVGDSYGGEGSDVFATPEELESAIRDQKDGKKELYVVPLSDPSGWTVPETRIVLRSVQMGLPWNSDPDTAPPGLVSDIFKKAIDSGMKPDDTDEAREEMRRLREQEKRLEEIRKLRRERTNSRRFDDLPSNPSQDEQDPADNVDNADVHAWPSQSPLPQQPPPDPLAPSPPLPHPTSGPHPRPQPSQPQPDHPPPGPQPQPLSPQPGPHPPPAQPPQPQPDHPPPGPQPQPFSPQPGPHPQPQPSQPQPDHPPPGPQPQPFSPQPGPHPRPQPPQPQPDHPPPGPQPQPFSPQPGPHPPPAQPPQPQPDHPTPSQHPTPGPGGAPPVIVNNVINIPSQPGSPNKGDCLYPSPFNEHPQPYPVGPGMQQERDPSAPPPQENPRFQCQGKKSKIFISFRVFEAKRQALALKGALEDRGLSTFCSSAHDEIEGGQEWVDTICSKLDESRMFVALVGRTYGGRGCDVFATAQELDTAIREQKKLYVVPLVPRQEWQEARIRVLLGSVQTGHSWDSDPDTAPPDLVSDIFRKAIKAGIKADDTDEARKEKRRLREHEEYLKRLQEERKRREEELRRRKKKEEEERKQREKASDNRPDDSHTRVPSPEQALDRLRQTGQLRDLAVVFDAAVRHGKADQTIDLGGLEIAGEFSGDLLVSAQSTLCNGTIRLPDGAKVRCNGDSSLSKLTITGGKRGFALDVRGGNVRMRDCSVEGGEVAAVNVAGHSSKLIASGSRFRSRCNGLQVLEKAAAVLERGCNVDGNGEIGISIGAGSKLCAEGLSACGNGAYNAFFEGADVELSHCTFNGCKKGHGVCITGPSKVRCSSASISSNAHGNLHASGSASVRLQDCSLDGSLSKPGLSVYDRGTMIKCISSSISRNASDAVRASSAARVELKNCCRCDDNKGFAFWVGFSATITADTSCTANGNNEGRICHSSGGRFVASEL